MFSSRTDFDLKPNELSRLASRLRREGAGLIDLTLSNPTQAGLEYPQECIREALGSPAARIYQPDPRGLRVAREAVARYYRERGLDVDPGDIVLTSSTSEAYSFLFKILADPGDTILIPSPSYPLFQFLAGLEGLRTEPYQLLYTDEWICDLEDLDLRARSSRAKAILLVHPNNPSGSYFRAEELAFLRSLSRRLELPLICDEVFFDYPLNDEIPRAEAAEDETCLTFLLNGLSKTVALPQLKLSWILVRGPRHLKRKTLERLEFVADTYLSVHAAVQHGAEELLQLRTTIQPRIRDRISVNLDSLKRRIEATRLRLLQPQGGWYAVLRLPAQLVDEQFSLDLLRERRTLVHPGSLFGFPDRTYLVASLLPEPEVFTTGIEALADCR